jgi:hypothetical protein
MMVFVASLFLVYMVSSVWTKRAGNEEMEELIPDVT